MNSYLLKDSLNETRISNGSPQINGFSPSSKKLPSNSGLPDLINQKTKDNITNENNLKSLDEIKFNEVEVSESLVKQLEYFDRDVRMFKNKFKNKNLSYFFKFRSY